ncbi:hypothetical protein PF010_g6931 [Phytophthora fragariae]|uniref:Uncharacterized protein n=1 Tax=Phytophthora fragariae TaxID=53985 RepID=A0A6G0S9M8_9STRA|nr:hypothetical protein PF010_g6931 [Phytophthora fragariae]KAE9352950.1 hypothetical protein PF008_g5224 [Phytophthora fragariae]
MGSSITVALSTASSSGLGLSFASPIVVWSCPDSGRTGPFSDPIQPGQVAEPGCEVSEGLPRHHQSPTYPPFRC